MKFPGSNRDPNLCKKEIPWGNMSSYTSQCTRKAKYEGFCKQHSSAEVEKKYTINEERGRKVREKRRQQFYGPDAIRALKSVDKLLRLGMAQSALDVTEAWLTTNKF